ncbi:MAG: hypothetical protein CR997_11660 [Acidobacteria bacterium]|nr:MAG: hypothetical protein CR997_11660 [Acidobacteriota bacterium]
MDCIILAGNKEGYKPVLNEKCKAAMLVNGTPILVLMLRQILTISALNRIIMIGNRNELKKITAGFFTGDCERLVFVQQKNNIVDSILYAVSSTEEEVDTNRKVMILPCDLPLMIAQEIEEFIRVSKETDFDYYMGLVTEESIKRFAPTQNLPGIEMMCFPFMSGFYRINNLHICKPHKFKHSKLIKKTYQLRHQKNILSIFRTILILISMVFKKPSTLALYFKMRLVHLIPCPKMSNWIRRSLKLEDAEKIIGDLIGVSFKTITTSYGGVAIDVDKSDDYKTINLRFEEWFEMQKRIAAKERSMEP